MALKRVVLLIGVLLVAGRASAQPFPNGTVPAHVICDSGCSGSVGATTVEQSDPTKLNATVSNANLDIALSALRDALRGASAKTLTDVVTALGALSVSITGSVAVTGPLTDTQLRASAVPVSMAVAPTTAVTNAGLTNLDVALSTRTKPADQQHTIIDSGTTAVTNTSLDGTTLASIKGDLDKIPTSPAQESGNLATIATNSGTQATAANQTTENTTLSTIATNTTNGAAAIDQPATTAPGYVMVAGATDLNGFTRATLSDPSGATLVVSRPAVPLALLLPCNALRRLNCR